VKRADMTSLGVDIWNAAVAMKAAGFLLTADRLYSVAERVTELERELWVARGLGGERRDGS
jgi:hypothetical protein